MAADTFDARPINVLRSRLTGLSSAWVLFLARISQWLREAGLGTKRGFDARLSGGGSYEGQCRSAFLLCRQENTKERTPRLLGRTVLCRLCNEL